ncbi:unnamed protein product [Clonostachys rosea f. rosea IK726]|uniref:Tse2 ADP-ribosyltransferase toxin domain-containing protein n=2 Tax=Bionectria ochroleuca TaxID=29856 RepID=A0A0B7JUZ0_BIOOC|nr:unnamed protein product [Clonostachys rosea f. rosea IK726]
MEQAAKSATIKVFRQFPKELFRINNGWQVLLRPRTKRSSGHEITTKPKDLFDLPDSKPRVEPKALDPETYSGPNGAAMFPNTTHLQYCILGFLRKRNPVIYKIQEGTKLPDELLLVRDTPDGRNWSLQPAQEMTLENLNLKITQFLRDNGAAMNRQQFLKVYPRATDSRSPLHPLPKNWKVKK